MKGQNTPAVFHPSSFNLLPFGLPGFPWRVRFHVQRRRPRDQRRVSKTRCEAWNKEHPGAFASGAEILRSSPPGARSIVSRNTLATMAVCHVPTCLNPALKEISTEVLLSLSWAESLSFSQFATSHS